MRGERIDGFGQQRGFVAVRDQNEFAQQSPRPEGGDAFAVELGAECVELAFLLPAQVIVVVPVGRRGKVECVAERCGVIRPMS